MKIIEIHPHYPEAKAKLETRLQKAIDRTTEKFWKDPKNPGLHDEKLTSTNGWRSLRVNVDVRIVYSTPTVEHAYFAYVNHHIAAYRWAESHKANTESGRFTLVTCESRTEVVTRVHYVENEETLLFSHLNPESLIPLGVPPSLVSYVRTMVTEKNFPDLLNEIDERAWENLEALYSGKTPPYLLEIERAGGPRQNLRPWAPPEHRALQNAVSGDFNRWSIFLHPDQAELIAKNFSGPARVFGGAGCGKSLIGIYRAARLASASEQSAILLTAHTPNVISKLGRDLDRLLEDAPEARSRITVASFEELVHVLWRPGAGSDAKVANDTYLEREVCPDMRGVYTSEQIKLIIEQWLGVIDAYGVQTIDQYLAVKHGPEVTCLSRQERKQVWAAVSEGRKILVRKRRLTLPAMVRQFVGQIAIDGPPFTNVVVDEAQLFTPVELEAIRYLAPKGFDDLFFCEDRRQSVRRGAFHWSHVGVDVKGRSFGLGLNYRTTEQIWRFSDRILGSSDPNESSQNNTQSLLQGEDPEIISCLEEDEEVAAICLKLRALTQDGFLAHEIAIIARNSGLLRARAERAARMAGLRSVELFKETAAEGSYITLTTMENAIGLEFRAVIVIGCEAESRHDYSVGLKDTRIQYREDVRSEAARLYIACTRARERLILTSAGPMSSLLCKRSNFDSDAQQ